MFRDGLPTPKSFLAPRFGFHAPHPHPEELVPGPPPPHPRTHDAQARGRIVIDLSETSDIECVGDDTIDLSQVLPPLEPEPNSEREPSSQLKWNPNPECKINRSKLEVPQYLEVPSTADEFTPQPMVQFSFSSSSSFSSSAANFNASGISKDITNNNNNNNSNNNSNNNRFFQNSSFVSPNSADKSECIETHVPATAAAEAVVPESEFVPVLSPAPPSPNMRARARRSAEKLKNSHVLSESYSSDSLSSSQVQLFNSIEQRKPAPPTQPKRKKRKSQPKKRKRKQSNVNPEVSNKKVKLTEVKTEDQLCFSYLKELQNRGGEFPLFQPPKEHIKRSWFRLDREIIKSATLPKFREIFTNTHKRASTKQKLDEQSRCDCEYDEDDPLSACGRVNCLNRSVYFECSKNCRNGEKCLNQNFSKRNYPATMAVKMGDGRGWGVIAQEKIASNRFIMEYTGHIIPPDECRSAIRKIAAKPDEEQEKINLYYLVLAPDSVIDASKKGSAARFINHSCDPNCVIRIWDVNGISRAGVFALDDIQCGEELTFDYDWDSHFGVTYRKRCKCGTNLCTGYIGGAKKRTVTPKPKRRRKKTRVRRNPENSCYVCEDGGLLICCDFRKYSFRCPKVYHQECLQLQQVPKTLVCPRHCCDEEKCTNQTVYYCRLCMSSWCKRHSSSFAQQQINKTKLSGPFVEITCHACLAEECTAAFSMLPSVKPDKKRRFFDLSQNFKK